VNFLRKKNEKNSYQIQNILKKSEIFIIDVYNSLKRHGLNKSYYITLKFENQQTMDKGPKFMLL